MKKSIVGAVFLSASLAFAGTTGAVAAGSAAGAEAKVAVQAADAGANLAHTGAAAVDHHVQTGAKLDAKAVEVKTNKTEAGGVKAPAKKEESKSGVKKTSGRTVSSVKDSRPAVNSTAK